MRKFVLPPVRVENRSVLTEIESKILLKELGLTVTQTALAGSPEEAVALGEQIGYPVAMKIISPDILHKSDCGGVRLGLSSPDAVAGAYAEILSAAKSHYPDAEIHGVSVQKMAEPGVEIIIGVTRDEQFGPAVMFGLGGIWVEVLKDVAFRIVPLERQDAASMIREIKGYSLLKGYRGQPPVDVTTLEDWLIAISDFVSEHPEIKEMDLNPVFAYADGAVVVDARILLVDAGDCQDARQSMNAT